MDGSLFVICCMEQKKRNIPTRTTDLNLLVCLFLMFHRAGNQPPEANSQRNGKQGTTNRKQSY